MIVFTTTILKFGQQGEKTGWTYFLIPSELAQQLIPENKKSFRVKGWLDDYPIRQVALLPMGEGDFIMPLNVEMRKEIKKQKGASLKIQLEVDTDEMKPSTDLLECLADEPAALTHFNSLPKGHQRYFTKWIESAKTGPTKAKRLANAVKFLSRGKNFGEMLRALKEENNRLDSW